MRENETAKFFDRYSDRFDAIYGIENSLLNKAVNRLWRESMKLRYLKTLEGCIPIEGRTVLDVGCGPGHFSIALAQRGAKEVLGIDFADGMIDLAKERAKQAGVADRCEFRKADFFDDLLERFDYSILMGFMDYMANPTAVIERIVKITRCKAFFSFPEGGTFLAWQRKIRYRNRCDLYLYSDEQIENLFRDAGIDDFKIEKISRDFFVTAGLERSMRSKAESPAAVLMPEGNSR